MRWSASEEIESEAGVGSIVFERLRIGRR
ncbi:MAG: hypothetical protein H6Q33_4965, partial [Deltaproteobacteria bacterium]|nr:hypothetical protein [Deltaproteobacteria bacterium]